MDGQEIVESLDSLWFFSNIFSSSTSTSPSFASCNNGKTTQSHLKEPPKPEQPKPITPILQKQQIQSAGTQVLIETSSKSSGFNVETELQIMIPEVVGAFESFSESTLKREKRRDKKCCKSSLKRWNKCHREQEFSHAEEFSDFVFSFREIGLEGGPVSVVSGFQQMEKICGFQSFGGLPHINMPPLSDGMAMKEHLKSWAYAVACTVK